jgi:hypothetical protein
MENAFRFSDNFGPARIISVYQPSLGLKAVSFPKIISGRIDDAARLRWEWRQ